MPDFAWRAADATGQILQGRLEAVSANAASRQLRERGLVPVSIADAAALAREAAADPGGAGVLSRHRFRRNDGPVTQAELLNLTSELSIMLRAGLTLASALRVLIDMSLRPPVASLLQQVLDAPAFIVALRRGHLLKSLVFQFLAPGLLPPFHIRQLRAL